MSIQESVCVLQFVYYILGHLPSLFLPVVHTKLLLKEEKLSKTLLAKKKLGILQTNPN